MDAEHIIELLQKLGCEKITQSTGGWVDSTCPLARWKHKTGRDRHPSFGVAITEGVSGYRCHACHSSGPLISLVREYGERSGRNMRPWVVFVEQHNAPAGNFISKKIERYKKIEQARWQGPVEIAGMMASPIALLQVPPDQVFKVLDESELNAFVALPPEIEAYLLGRGFTRKTLDAWGVRWHEGARRITIPIRDLKKQLVGISGRAWDPDAKPKYLHSTGFARDFYLYGEDKIEKSKPAILVEGFFDVMALWQAGYANALAIMGSHLSKFQIEKVVKHCSSVVVLPDGDAPGQETAQKIAQVLSNRLHVRVASCVMGKDPDELTQDQLREFLGDSVDRLTIRE